MRRKSYAMAGACVALASIITSLIAWKQHKASEGKRDTHETPAQLTSGARGVLPSADALHSLGVITAQSGAEKLVLEPADFLRGITAQGSKTARIPLPGGQFVEGEICRMEQDADGVCLVSGRIVQPYPGQFYFLRQPLPNKAGPLVGHVLFDEQDTAYRIFPGGADAFPELRKVTADEVVCRAYPGEPQEAPQTHPTDLPKPAEQGVVPVLESLPGAQAVVYLDFDGESGTFTNWNNNQPINAAPSTMTTANIIEIWQRVAEDYQPFNINISTVRKTYEAAPVTSRMHVIVTPTSAWYGQPAGGVAYMTSFNFNDTQKVCWVFAKSSAKSCAEAAAHEIGHTLGLDHDGKVAHDGVEAVEYYGGQGTNPVGWAPIMGVGYGQNITQWSKGEYRYANNQEDDLAIISGQNNNVAYRTDDMGETFATARMLEVLKGGALVATPGCNEGVIETAADRDAFRFATAGGVAALTIAPASRGANLDVLAEIVPLDGAGNPLEAQAITSNPDTDLKATFNVNLAAGNYLLRISGVGRGDPAVDGYSDYSSLGSYLISGNIAGAVYADYFTLAENSTTGTQVGAVVARANHTGNKTFAITESDPNHLNGAFAIDSSTGIITVANRSLLDFEALSSQWDDPASFELNVRVSDSDDSASENLRVVVTLSDLNEAPSPHAPVDRTLTENTAVGTEVAMMAASDPDRFDFLSYAITAGDPDGVFVIDPTTGVVKTAKSLDGAPNFSLTIRASDSASPALACTTTLNVATPRMMVVPANVGVIMEPGVAEPAGGAQAYAWSQLQGPRIASFATPNAAQCSTTFSVGGAYQLRLTMTNGSATVVDDVVLICSRPASFTYGTATGGSVTKVSETSFKLSGASSGIDSGGTADGFRLYGMTFDGDFDLRTRVVSGTNVTGTTYERAGLIVRAGTAGAAGEASAYVGFDTTPSEWGHWVVRGVSGGANASATFSDAAKALPSWCRLTRFGTTVSAYFSEDGVDWGTAVGTSTMEGSVRAGLCWSSDSTSNGNATFDNVSFAGPGNMGPTVNAGSDQTVAAATATLTATVDDDGKPAAAPTVAWQKISGPGRITFDSPASTNPNVTASQPGTYVLRAIADDGEVKTFDDVQVVFNFTTPYGGWATSRFGANATNPAVAGDLADPDGDGRANLMEYALNGNPNAPDQGGITTDIETIGGQSYLRVVVNKNSSANDVTIVAEVSQDLGAASWIGGGEITVEVDTPTQYVARDNTPISAAACRYIRARVTRN